MNGFTVANIFGWMFFIVGFIIIVLNFINASNVDDEKTFRALVIGLIVFVSGSIILANHYMLKTLQQEKSNGRV